jgi:hypothetical protein
MIGARLRVVFHDNFIEKLAKGDPVTRELTPWGFDINSDDIPALCREAFSPKSGQAH